MKVWRDRRTIAIHPEEGGDSVRQVPEYDAKSWLSKALRETPHAMESLLWSIDDDELDRRPDEDEWSASDLVIHMAEMERRYAGWLERIAQLDEPRIDAFDADSIDLSERDRTLAPFEVIDEFAMLRRQAVYLLWSLDDADWGRCGIHPYLGRLTLMRVAQEMNEHDLAHLWQLRRLCDRIETASV